MVTTITETASTTQRFNPEAQNPNPSKSQAIPPQIHLRHSLPPKRFHVLLTLFSKFFSPFPHGTCLLSVSCLYLALDGIYHPFTLLSQGTRLGIARTVRSRLPSTNGIFTLHDALFQETYLGATTGILPKPHVTCKQVIGHWAVPCSFATTKGILVSFFSSAY
jgi:hypothetical protein